MTNPRCFQCDGTGQMCNVCGESEAACRCTDNTYYPCDACEDDDGAPAETKETDE